MTAAPSDVWVVSAETRERAERHLAAAELAHRRAWRDAGVVFAVLAIMLALWLPRALGAGAAAPSAN